MLVPLPPRFCHALRSLPSFCLPSSPGGILSLLQLNALLLVDDSQVFSRSLDLIFPYMNEQVNDAFKNWDALRNMPWECCSVSTIKRNVLEDLCCMPNSELVQRGGRKGGGRRASCSLGGNTHLKPETRNYWQLLTMWPLEPFNPVHVQLEN